MGDAWLAEIPEQLHKVGVPVVCDDSPGLFPPGYPMTDCALYYGWYAGQVTGPFAQPEFRFVSGAVAVHIHSFSGATLRDPNANWVAPLVAHGAAATIGNVYEPYLQLTAHLDVFNDRLLHGFTFAESAYMSMPALSWMSVMVGDPLYRPYAAWLQIDAAREFPRPVNDWKAYHDFAVKNGSRPAPEYRTLARQFASRARNGSVIEDLGRNGSTRWRFRRGHKLFSTSARDLHEARRHSARRSRRSRCVGETEQIEARCRSCPKCPACCLGIADRAAPSTDRARFDRAASVADARKAVVVDLTNDAALAAVWSSRASEPSPN